MPRSLACPAFAGRNSADVIDIEAAFDEELFHIAVRQGEPQVQVPPRRQHDHLGREPDPVHSDVRTGGQAGRRRITRS
ncbi:hypothetical protein [Frankia sp. R43]|uniref:hypothetical protein n=1 Tax=Frankia sp. R43 TaxID=269536 RepID=UPI001F20AC2C|nr:hypothetical protein [Frankia sp. R43]